MEITQSKIRESAAEHQAEISAGERFEFGKNWTAFLAHLNEDRILKAEESLCEMLETGKLEGKRFLDIGSGSGLFSLAAKRLGAEVRSFDYDPYSVACTAELKNRYFPDDASWQIGQGSALDEEFLGSLGKFDVVYSWGVLHHTGKMWDALENASRLVENGGKLFIALYNDTGSQADRWRWIKKTYCKLPKALRTPYTILAMLPDETKRLIGFTIKGKPFGYVEYLKNYRNGRGMNHWRDMVDWVGGYPYEVATPDEIFEFYKAKGFRLTKLRTGGVGLGCNEFVFEKSDPPSV